MTGKKAADSRQSEISMKKKRQAEWMPLVFSFLQPPGCAHAPHNPPLYFTLCIISAIVFYTESLTYNDTCCATSCM